MDLMMMILINMDVGVLTWEVEVREGLFLQGSRLMMTMLMLSNLLRIRSLMERLK